MFYTNTSSSLRNVLDEDLFVVEDVDTWFQHHDLLLCRCAGAGMGFSPSSCFPQPRLTPLHKYPTIVSLSLCQPVDLWSCFSLSAALCSPTELSPESLAALGTLVCWGQGDSKVESCWSYGWLWKFHQCVYWWVQKHFHHVQSEGKILFYLSTRSPLAECRDGSWLVAKGLCGQLLAPKSER